MQTELSVINEMIEKLEIRLKSYVLVLTELSSEMSSITGKVTAESEKIDNAYYTLLEKTKVMRAEISELQNKRGSLIKAPVEPVETEAAKRLKEQRAIKEASVTSTTYERAQKRLMNQVDGFISGRGR